MRLYGKIGTKFSIDMQERYARQIMLPEIGIAGQERLRNASVLIVGVGGLGSPVTLYLASCGVGRIGIIDPDVVSLSNLQRQILYNESELGLQKTYCTTLRIKRINGKTIVEQHNTRLHQENACDIIKNYDLVIDCSDNASTRYLIDDVCSATKKPFVYGAITEFCGQVSVFDSTQKWRYIDLFPNRNEAVNIPTKVRGVIGSLPGIIGSIQATEAIKLITQLGEPLIGKLFTIDIRTMESHTLRLK